MENIAQQIRELISRNELEKALSIFEDINRMDNSTEHFNEIILLRSQYFRLEAEIRKGLLNKEEESLNWNKIVISFLHLISYWEEQGGVITYMLNANKETRSSFLDLGNCGLKTLPKLISDFTWLKKLSLGEGWYEHDGEQFIYHKSKNTGTKNNIGELNNSLLTLNNLTHLWIIGDQGSKYEFDNIAALETLNSLEAFYCDYTHVSDLTPLSKLSKLKILSCVSTKVVSIQPLENLANLEKLNFDATPLVDLNPIEKLEKLETLSIERTKVEDLSPISGLNQLEYLNCIGTKITSLEPLKGLKLLTTLLLDETNAFNLSPLSELFSLQELSFAATKINNLEPLAQLSQLTSIQFPHTQVIDLTPLKNLNNLQKIDLSHTPIKSLEPLSAFPSLREFFVEGCDIQDTPTDVWESKDARQLRAYFVQKQPQPPPTSTKSANKEGEKNRRDVKLILLGNSASGKTSLVHFLKREDKDTAFLETRNSTHGLEVHRWLPNAARFPLLKDVAVSIWDFGGQEYYHGAYRLFLSANAVYLLLWDEHTDLNGRRNTLLKDSEKEQPLEHFEKQYWLDTIRYYGGQAKTTPLLVVQNKVDNLEANKKRISQQLHDQYAIWDSFHISLLEGSKTDRPRHSRLLRYFTEELEQMLAAKADEATVPLDWEKIRQELLALHNPPVAIKNHFFSHRDNIWIPLTDFEKICAKIVKRKLTDDELHTLPRWLERGGVIVFFADSPTLNDKVFLHPNILARHIYEVLDQDVLKNYGVFSKTDIELKDHDFPNIFIEAAQKLELIFPHPDSQKIGQYIAPQYLPENHPIEDLFKIAAHGAWQSAFWLKVPLFHYKKLLHGLILYYVADNQVEARHFWKHGIVFLKKNVRILLKGLYPAEHEHEGILLIGVEKTNDFIQHEVQEDIFFKCLDLLVTFIRSPTLDWKEDIKRLISQTMTEQLVQQLTLLEVSADGENYVPYFKLLQNAKQGESKMLAANGKDYLFLRDFTPLLPRPPKRAKRIFLSYSHQNAQWLNRLRTHLSGLRRSKDIETWTDQEILPGEPWDKAIRDKLASADIFILLLSADFIASDYIWETELPIIFEKLRAKRAILIPVLTEPHDLGGLPGVSKSEDGKSLKLNEFGIIPKDENEFLKPISLWANPEEGLTKVAEEIRKAVHAQP